MTAIESALQTLLQTDATLAAALPGAVHLVTVTATGGTFTLTFAAVTTTAIAEAATAATVQAALVALATVGTGNVAVTGAAGGALTGSGANLTGPGAALTIAQRAAVYNTLALKPPVSYLTFALVSSTPQFIFGGLASEQYRYQVTVVTQGASRATVNTALTRVDALLAFGDLTVSGETSWGTRKLGDGPSMAQEVGGALWQWGSADYMVELGS
jgi:hypothetical protein